MRAINSSHSIEGMPQKKEPVQNFKKVSDFLLGEELSTEQT
jgi:hypothetical protein